MTRPFLRRRLGALCTLMGTKAPTVLYYPKKEVLDLLDVLHFEKHAQGHLGRYGSLGGMTRTLVSGTLAKPQSACPLSTESRLFVGLFRPNYC